MSQPHTCPVCNGAGTVSKPPYIAGDIDEWFSGDTRIYECNACDGKGIVWEPDTVMHSYLR